MMANKATAGPWEYVISDGIFSGGKRLAALSYAGRPISQKITYEEQEANARLIAAAPELRDFVAQIARLTKDGEETPEHPHGYDMPSDDAVDTVAGLVNAARALLARIAGGDHGDD